MLKKIFAHKNTQSSSQKNLYEDALNALEELSKKVYPQVRQGTGMLCEGFFGDYFFLRNSNWEMRNGVKFMIHHKPNEFKVNIIANVYQSGSDIAVLRCSVAPEDFLNGKIVSEEFKNSLRTEVATRLNSTFSYEFYSLEQLSFKNIDIWNMEEQQREDSKPVNEKSAYMGLAYSEISDKEPFLIFGEPESILITTEFNIGCCVCDIGVYNSSTNEYEKFQRYNIRDINQIIDDFRSHGLDVEFSLIDKIEQYSRIKGKVCSMDEILRQDASQLGSVERELRNEIIAKFHKNAVEQICKDIKNHGLKPEKQLVDKIEQYNGIKGKIHSLNEILSQDASERDSTAGMLQKEITSEVHRQTALKARGVIEVQSLHPVP